MIVLFYFNIYLGTITGIKPMGCDMSVSGIVPRSPTCSPLLVGLGQGCFQSRNIFIASSRCTPVFDLLEPVH